MSGGERQLAVLRTTYPGWDITLAADGWSAVLRRDITPQMKRAGVEHTIRRADPYALASAPSLQVVLIRNTRIPASPNT